MTTTAPAATQTRVKRLWSSGTEEFVKRCPNAKRPSPPAAEPNQNQHIRQAAFAKSGGTGCPYKSMGACHTPSTMSQTARTLNSKLRQVHTGSFQEPRSTFDVEVRTEALAVWVASSPNRGEYDTYTEKRARQRRRNRRAQPSPHVRLRQRATVYRVPAQDMVQCVVNRLLSCPLVCSFCAWGAALGNARKVSTPPSPKGRYPASRRTRHSCRPPGRPCRESPGLFVLSLSHSSECNRQWVVNPPAQLPWIAPAAGLLAPATRVSTPY